MTVHQLAGKQAPRSILANIPQLITDYYSLKPDPRDPSQRIEFGTSGHRGSSFRKSFNEDHILAVAQAICDYRVANHIGGPLFLGKDTHALSEPGFASVLEVLAANDVRTVVQEDLGVTPTPVISHAILTYNRPGHSTPADGIVITPSHNPPEDGGIKYNPPSGGPGDTGVTRWIQDRANACMEGRNSGVRRIAYEKALGKGTTTREDFIGNYVADLGGVIDMDVIRSSGLKIGADPMGGSSLPVWQSVSERCKINIDVVNSDLDPAFGFMTVDRDGKIRMDCSSPYAMAVLIQLKDRYDVAFGNDPDSDRHGIVTRSAGLMNPNHYLSAAIWYLFRNRPEWKTDLRVAKTLVSSSMIDRVAHRLGRPLYEVPVGFKWFVDGLLEGSFAFAGEESAGAAFLRKNGTVWTTDKDGIILNLLAAEMTAVTGRDPGEIYRGLVTDLGEPVYERIDAPAGAAQKAVFSTLSPADIPASTLAGEPILAKLTKAPGNGAPIGGVKVVAENGWFAARPSGTEDVYKIYTESFKGREHLLRIQDEARLIVGAAFRAAGV